MMVLYMLIPWSCRTRPSLVRDLTLLIVAMLCLSGRVADAKPASVASIEPADLVEFETLSPDLKKLVEVALDLTDRKLGYRFGSNSPDKKGMDCSGAVQHTLQAIGLEGVPRSSHVIYQWVEHHGKLVDTQGVESVDDPVFSRLQPGDLLFWEGTYNTAKRNPPISHVMIYLGTLKADGKGVVFGSSDGRRFRGKSIHGVSVFDWTVPPKESKSKFVAYGPIPGLEVADEGGNPKKVESEKRGKRQNRRSLGISGLLKSTVDKIRN